MANRYSYQFNASLKPKMAQIEGFVSIGTGGQLNAPVIFPLSASGTFTGGSQQTGYLSMALLPGQATAGLPTGWQGGFSGCWGLLGAGVAGIARVGTGMYAVQLQDDWCRLDSCQVEPYLGATGLTNLSAAVVYHTVGLGNSQLSNTGATGVSMGGTMKNQIVIQFQNNGLGADHGAGGGFFLDIRLRDSTAGPQ